jgi:hypothetical protein
MRTKPSVRKSEKKKMKEGVGLSRKDEREEHKKK